LDEEITQKVMELGSTVVKKGVEVEVIHLQAA
jgi:hypothetical protein